MNFKNLFTIAKKEFEIVRSELSIFAIVFLAPLFFAFFYATVYMNKVETDVPVAVVNMDKSETAAKITRFLDSHALLKIENDNSDYNRAKKLLHNENVQGIVYIPVNFEKHLKSGKGADVKVYLNTTRFLVSNDINKAVNEVIATVGAGVRIKFFQAKGYSYEQAKQMIEPLRVDMRSLFNFTEGYGDFMIPGLLLLILQQTLLLGVGQSVAKEKEEGTLIKNLKNFTSGTIIFGKFLFYFPLFLTLTIFFYLVCFGIFSIPLNASLWSIILIVSLHLTAIYFLGFFVATYFTKKISALQFMAFSSLPLFLISGFSWPTSQMPFVIQWFAALIPSTASLKIMTNHTIIGAPLYYSALNILLLIGLMFVYYFLSVLRLNFLRKAKR